MAARVAVPAREQRFDRDPLTDADRPVVPVAEGDHDPGELMPLGPGVGGIGVAPVVEVEVGAADTDPLDAHQGLAGRGRRLGSSDDLDPSGLHGDRGLHDASFDTVTMPSLVGRR